MRISRKSFIKKYKKAKNCNTRIALLKWKKVMSCFGKGSSDESIEISMNQFGAVNNNGVGNSYIIARNHGNADPFKLSYIRVHNFQRSVPNPLQNPEEYFFIKKYLNGTTIVVPQGTQQFNNFVAIPEVIGLFNLHNTNPFNLPQLQQLFFFQNMRYPINQDHTQFNGNDTMGDTRSQPLPNNTPSRYLLANDVLSHRYLTHVGLADLRTHLINNCQNIMNTLAGGVNINNIQNKVCLDSCLYSDGNTNLDNKMIREYMPVNNNAYANPNNLANEYLRECQSFLNFKVGGNQKYHLSFKSNDLNTQEISQVNPPPPHGFITRHPPPNGAQVRRSSKGYRNAPHFYHFKLQEYNGADVNNSCYYWYLVFDIVYQRFTFIPTRSVPQNIRNDANINNFLDCVTNFFNNNYLNNILPNPNPNNPPYVAVRKMIVNGTVYNANDPWGYFTVSQQDINDINNAANVVQLNF